MVVGMSIKNVVVFILNPSVDLFYVDLMLISKIETPLTRSLHTTERVFVASGRFSHMRQLPYYATIIYIVVAK